MVNIVTGDIFKSDVNIIGHQTNAQGAMGRGIALTIKQKYPEVNHEYIEYCKHFNKSTELLGHCQVVMYKEGKFIANIFGQFQYGRCARQTNYTALRNGLIRLKEFAMQNNLTIGLPYLIGAGLAGGEIGTILKILDEVFSDYDVTLYKL